MPWEAWLTLAVIFAVLVGLVRGDAGADALLAGAVVFLVAVGEFFGTDRLLSIKDAAAGLGNTGLATVGVLFIVVAGLTHTRATSRFVGPMLGNPKTTRGALARLMAPVIGMSAFLNNTPVVAMFLPVVDDYSKRTKVAPSLLYMPMAFAATFGGVCTLIGTSTNLVVTGMYEQQFGKPCMGLFDLSWVGIPGALVAASVTLVLAPVLLKDRRPALDADQDRRTYFLDMVVLANGPLVGKTVQEAGLRSLPRLFLAEIERDGQVAAPVSSGYRLQASDRLSFVGDVEAVVELQRIIGLVAPESDSKAGPRGKLLEAVVSGSCPLVGTTVREGNFRTVYDAAIVAIARGADRIPGRLGDVELQNGDTLLLEAGEDFLARFRNSRDFYLVSGVENGDLPNSRLAPIALGILAAVIGSATIGWLDLLTAACLGSIAMVATGCCTSTQARQSIDWSLLVAIAASLGLGLAIRKSGLDETLSDGVIGFAGASPWWALAGVYFVTMILTELVTNNAAAVLVYPLAVSTAAKLGVDVTPFLVAIMIGASAGFATPFGYQTNLMVYGPGGYRFTDYVKLGVPLDLAFFAVTVALAPLMFPFHP
ncbi:MAG: SLC13 family permease [Lacipirellulaceae bacterium]